MNNGYDDGPRRDYVRSTRRPPVILIGGLVLALVVGLGAFALAMGSGGGDSGDKRGLSSSGDLSRSNAGPDEAPTTVPEPTPEPTPVPPPPTPEPPPEPTAVPQLQALGSGDRIAIPRFGINAPLTYKTVGSNGQMPDPDGTDDVAYYNFSNFSGFGGAPGRGGNAVFAGHVDSGSKRCDYGKTPPPCGAVFWNLSKVGSGDEITVQVSGTVYRYRVTSVQSIAETADWTGIVAATAKETITIITCGGNFNPRTRSYDQRQVVKGERV